MIRKGKCKKVSNRKFNQKKTCIVLFGKKQSSKKKSSSGWRWIPRDAKIRNGDAKIWWCYKQTPVNADCIFSTTTYNDLKQLCASTQAFDGTYT